jgi:amidase
MTQLWQRSARELAEQVAGRRTTATDLVEAHLARIAQVNPQLNAIVRVLGDEARADAARADAAQARGERLGPLHGVPFTVKENIDVAGLPTTWGVPALAGAVVPVDAPVVRRMRAAGAIPIGRTNLPDMALRITTESSLHGATRNPWHPWRTAGGSSGGDAAALATGMTPMGLGNDLGGSLRNPASACGIASIRPSAGRVPDAGYVPSEDRLLAVQLMNVQGPMARRVADVRLMLRVLSGADPRDPWSADAPAVPRSVDGPVRVAVLPNPPGGDCDPAVAAAVRRAADALADAGYEPVEACPPRYEEVVHAWAQLLLTDFASVMPQMAPLIGAEGSAFLEAAVSAVPPFHSAAELSHLLALRDGLGRAWSGFFADHPLLLSPTWTQLPFAAGADATPAGAAAAIAMMRPVVPANLLGLPSACVNAGSDAASGLPIGVLITGPRWRDEACLDAAEAIESRCAVSTPIEPRQP